MEFNKKTLIENKFFNIFICTVIIFNCVVIGLLTSPTIIESKYRSILLISDRVCLSIFIVELALRIICDGRLFFSKSWNIFDFVIIMISIIAEVPALTSGRIFRVFYIFRSAYILRILKGVRAFRLVADLEKMRRIIKAVVKAFPSIVWTVLLLALIYYVYAVIGVSIFGKVFPDFFGELSSAFFSLFQVMTFDGWSSTIARPIMSEYPYAWIYFISFLLVSAFIIMNVVVGIVVNSISEISENKEKDELCEIKQELKLLRESIENLKNKIE